MAEEVTAAVEEERELASQPIPGLVRKYTIVTGQGDRVENVGVRATP